MGLPNFVSIAGLHSIYRRPLRSLQEGQGQALYQVISPYCNCILSENTEGGDQAALKVLVSRLHLMCANLQGKYMTFII